MLGSRGFLWVWIMGSQNVMGLGYGSNISDFISLWFVLSCFALVFVSRSRLLLGAHQSTMLKSRENIMYDRNYVTFVGFWHGKFFVIPVLRTFRTITRSLRNKNKQGKDYVSTPPGRLSLNRSPPKTDALLFAVFFPAAHFVVPRASAYESNPWIYIRSRNLGDRERRRHFPSSVYGPCSKPSGSRSICFICFFSRRASVLRGLDAEAIRAHAKHKRSFEFHSPSISQSIDDSAGDLA